MKALTLLLFVSLLANGALVVGLIRSRSPVKSPLEPPPVQSSNPSSEGSIQQVLPGSVLTSSGQSAIADSRLHSSSPTLWSLLHTDDFGVFKRKLEAAGFPPREIRALLAAAIGARDKMRRDALLGNSDDTPYWQTRSFPSDPALQAKFFALSQESAALVSRYIDGTDALAEDDAALTLAQRRYGNLSLDKLQQLRALEWSVQSKQMAIYQSELADRSPEAQKARAVAMKSLDDEKMAVVARLLTPDELEQFELRNSELSNGMRQQLENFQPTEAEFKALYTINRKMRSLYATTASTPAEMSAVREQWSAQIQQALSPERYADHQAVENAGSDKLGKLITRLELPPSTIGKVNAVRDDIMTRAKAINNDDNLPTAQRDARFAALAAEANEKLTSTLGARGYEAYVDLKGDWIRALKKTPAPGQ